MINLKTTTKDILQGEWNQLQGAVRQQWGKLTNDDLAVAQGNWEQTVGQLQARYGYTRADAETRLDAFVNNWNVNVRKPAADTVDDAQSSAADAVQSAKSTVTQAVDNVSSTVSDSYQSAKSTVTDAAQQAQEAVSNAAQQTQQTVSQTAGQVQDAAVSAGTTVDKKVKRNRWKVLVMTLLTGIGIGYWLSNQ